jgi:hypothetical protein
MTLKEKESLKNEIITEIYNTGRIRGLYFGQTSKSTNPANQVKRYLEILLFKNFMLRPDSEYLDDCYQELFLHLQNIPTEKFVELYNLGDSVLMSYILRIAMLRLFSVDRRTMNPKHSFAKQMDYASIYNKNNAMINPIEIVSDEIDFSTNEEMLIIYDSDDAQDEFENDYGFNVEEVLSHMTSEQRFVFERMLDNSTLYAPFNRRTRGRQSTVNKIKEDEIKRNFFTGVKEIEMFITAKNNILKKEYR